MKGVKRVTRGTILVAAALWFALSCGMAWATEPAGPQAEVKAAQVVAAAESTPGATHVAQEGKAVEHAAAEHGEAHHGGSLSPAKLKDLGWRVMNFIVLMIILIKFGAKPIAASLSGRRMKIRTEIEDLDAKKAEAEKSYREFEAKLASIEKEIDTIVEKAVAQAEVEKARILEKAEQAAADIQRQAEMAIQQEIMEARRMLKNEIADQAAVMAEQLIIKNLNDNDQVKIIEDYLIKVGAVQ